MAREWETRFANRGEEALAMMDERQFDVVVSDMRMPGMDGAQLLNQVPRRHLHMVRIILSGCSGFPQGLKLTEAAVKMAAYRLCFRYREILRAQIAVTVAVPDEVEDELRHLFSVFGPCRLCRLDYRSERRLIGGRRCA